MRYRITTTAAAVLLLAACTEGLDPIIPGICTEPDTLVMQSDSTRAPAQPCMPAPVRTTTRRRHRKRGASRHVEDELRRMKDRLEEIAGDMDAAVTVCACCDRQSWENPDEFTIARSLNALAGKIERVANDVRGTHIKYAQAGAGS